MIYVGITKSRHCRCRVSTTARSGFFVCYQLPPGWVLEPSGHCPRQPPLLSLSSRSTFQSLTPSGEIENRPGSRVSSSGRPRTADTNHNRGVARSNDVDGRTVHYLQGSKDQEKSLQRVAPDPHHRCPPRRTMKILNRAKTVATSRRWRHPMARATSRRWLVAWSRTRPWLLLKGYTQPPRPHSYAAAAPRPLSNREHHLQLAGQMHKMEMKHILNRRQEKLSEMAEQYYRHLLDSASPVSVASPKTSSADDISSEVSSPPSLNSTVSRTMHPVQKSLSVVQLSSDFVCQTAHGTNRTESSESQPSVSHSSTPSGIVQRARILMARPAQCLSSFLFRLRRPLHHTAAHPRPIYAGALESLVQQIRTSCKFWTSFV